MDEILINKDATANGIEGSGSYDGDPQYPGIRDGQQAGYVDKS